MNWKDSYNDICAELRIMQIHEMELRKRWEIAQAVVVSGEATSSGDYCHIPLDKAFANYNAAVDQLTIVQEAVDHLRSIKEQMEKEMGQFTGLAHVIQYKRMVEGKSYAQIALETGYSESHLRSTLARKRNKDAKQSANAS